MLIVVTVITAVAATVLWYRPSAGRWAAAVIGRGLGFARGSGSGSGVGCGPGATLERDDDLYLSHGLWSRELIVIPYGRMQAVKVESGPLTRALGLANVELVTASLQFGSPGAGTAAT